MGFRTLRDEAFDVSGGTVRKEQRQQSGSDQSWNITVQPDGQGDVSIQLPATGSCSASGAICTSDGRPLSNALAATVTGPAAMTVADARVEEVANALVPFRRDPEPHGNGAGDRRLHDPRRQRPGRLGLHGEVQHATFEAGESSKTIEAAVLDDSHDEGEETFTLALSNASGCGSRTPRRPGRSRTPT